jgi:MYXO-CTERM domain-containing protein
MLFRYAAGGGGSVTRGRKTNIGKGQTPEQLLAPPVCGTARKLIGRVETGGNQMRISALKHAALAAALALSPAAALAQNDTATTTTTADPTYAQPVQQEDDDDFPWGLLGLLGLAGLLGLKKRERDIHVDARRNP